MNIADFREFCLAKKAVEETLPFGPDTLVFKVMGKMFALTGLENEPFTVALKCDPERSLELRENYPGIIEGAYHMNKKHWNNIKPQELPPKLTISLINHSYALVVEGLPKKLQRQLEE